MCVSQRIFSLLFHKSLFGLLEKCLSRSSRTCNYSCEPSILPNSVGTALDFKSLNAVKLTFSKCSSHKCKDSLSLTIPDARLQLYSHCSFLLKVRAEEVSDRVKSRVERQSTELTDRSSSGKAKNEIRLPSIFVVCVEGQPLAAQVIIILQREFSRARTITRY